jgi:nicotinamidase-related amidase
MSPRPNTAVILIDPYNDFLHPSGKLNPLVATSKPKTPSPTSKTSSPPPALTTCPSNYGLHQQTRPGSPAGWNHATPLQKSQKESVAFEEGSLGVEIFEGLGPEVKKGDVVVSKHWSIK